MSDELLQHRLRYIMFSLPVFVFGLWGQCISFNVNEVESLDVEIML